VSATRAPIRCSHCGGQGHNAKTCGRKNGVRPDGARVRELAPGVSGEELASLARPTKRISAAVGGGANTVDVELRVRVRIEIQVVTLEPGR